MLILDLRFKTVPVQITGEDGVKHDYTLRMLSAAERDDYLQALSKRTQVKQVDGKTSATITSFKGMQAELVGLCLRDESGNAIEQSVLQSWPGPVMGALYAECGKLNDVGDEKKAADAGKD